MSASQCRCLGPTGNGVVGRRSRCAGDARKGDTGGRRAVIGLLGAMIVLGAGLFQPGRSRAQEAPAKAELPRQNEPVQAKDLPALSDRYRFIETYAVDENPAKPELIVQYQVGSLETIKVEVEKAQGAPDRNEGTIQTIYTERPAKVTRLGEVTDLVRRYDQFRPAGGYQAVEHAKPPLVKDLLIWCHFQKGALPQIISLLPDRPLREEEFDAITPKIFLPQLKSILPPTPMRVGDTWPLKPSASRSLLGDSVADDVESNVKATLIEVVPSANGGTFTAKIEIAGSLRIKNDPAGVKAWVFFTFAAPSTESPLEPGAKPKTKTRGDIIEARGSITRLNMARTLSTPQEENPRLNEILTKSLILVRKRSTDLLEIPAAPPVADRTNSWLIYDDPQSRFYFNHPQELVHVSNKSPENADTVVFVHEKPTGTDVLSIAFQSKELDPVRNREKLDPSVYIRNLRANWQRSNQDVIEGASGWLPTDAETPPNRKVYRFEAALKRDDPAAPRATFIYYLILDPKGSVVVNAITALDDQREFRKNVESALKSIQFGKRAGSTVPAAGPAAATAPARFPGTSTAPNATGTPAITPPATTARPQ